MIKISEFFNTFEKLDSQTTPFEKSKTQSNEVSYCTCFDSFFSLEKINKSADINKLRLQDPQNVEFILWRWYRIQGRIQGGSPGV